MSFSYSGDPANSEVDAVRYLIGDTEVTGALVSDEEIQYSIDKWYPLYGTLEWVASTILDTLAGKFAREASYSADGVSVTLSNLQKQLMEQAAALRAQHHSTFVGALADVGGVSPYEGLTPGVRPFAFGTNMHDNDEAGQQDYGGVTGEYPNYVPEEDPGV